MTWIDLSRGTDGYRFTILSETWISEGSIFYSVALRTKDVGFLTLLLLLFSADCNISTRYLDILHAGVPRVHTIVLMGQFLYGLWAFTVSYNQGGRGSDRYIWKCSLSVNFFPFLGRHNIFRILLVNLNIRSFSAILAFPSCSLIFCIAFFLWQYYKFWILIKWINFTVFVVLYLH